MKNPIKLWTLLTVMTIYSCGKNQEYKGTSADVAQKEKVTVPESDRKVENAADRKVIKEGEIAFETADVTATKSLIANTIQELNGYISKDDANVFSDRFEHRLTIRIPSDKFDILLKRISENVKKLDSKNINVLDVTAEFIDLDARIKTKKELQDRYKEILKQAAKVEEILSIEKEIGQLETDIESVEGQMKYLKDRISYSTLNVTYYEKTSALFGFPEKFSDAIKSGWDLLLMFIIALTHLWAFILIGIVVYYFTLRMRKRKKKNG